MKQRKLDWTNGYVVLLLAGLCCFLWGSATPAIKTGYRLFQIDSEDTSSILLFAGTRFLLAGFLVIAYHSWENRRWILPPKDSTGSIINLALTQTILQYICFYVGLSHASGVHGAIITGTNVFFSIVIASLVFRYEALQFRKLLGCALGFAGIVIVNLNGGDDGLLQVSLMGEGLVLAAQIFYAISSVLVKKYSARFDVVMMSGYQFMLGGFVLMIVGALSGGTLSGAEGVEALVLLLYMGILSAVAYTVWGLLIKYNPVSRVTIYGFMNPMFGVLLSAVLLDEGSQALSWNTLIALILVCLGIFVVNAEKKD